jgi:hypothetical protein
MCEAQWERSLAIPQRTLSRQTFSDEPVINHRTFSVHVMNYLHFQKGKKSLVKLGIFTLLPNIAFNHGF